MDSSQQNESIIRVVEAFHRRANAKRCAGHTIDASGAGLCPLQAYLFEAENVLPSCADWLVSQVRYDRFATTYREYANAKAYPDS